MIHVEGLTRRYGDFTAVEDVSFTIGHGEIVGLLGHNGAGKSTIMKMMTGFLEPSAGRVAIDGLDIARDRRAAQARIGYLPENCPIYPDMTVIDFLAYAAELRGLSPAQVGAAVREAIFQTSLADKAAHPIATLSRGYRQRVGVAQAILHHPRIVILDEPTNGLDPAQILQMRDLVRQLARNATVILSTHILQEVQAVCERAIIVRAGRVALDSRLADIQSARRLLVALDAAPATASPTLAGVAGVTGVEYLGGEGARHRYALAIAGDADEAGAHVAQAAHGTGLRLFALYPEQRSLDTVFADINAQRETAHA
jgi:ABC-2 type transport system ATP-binding protein